ncbi:MAG: nucleoside 2-deoxyribosyltransferase [Acidobacteriia bacterium]|nr:nucleoside 2-deoxyribosyltransferase [Terriglobia bacterium]
MASQAENCAICDQSPSDGVKMRNSGIFDGLLIDCPRCGQYELVGLEAISSSYKWTPEIRSSLSCAARQAFAAGQPLRITAANVVEFAGPHMDTRVSDNQERLLREAARRAGRPQMGASFSLTQDFTLIDCHSAEEFNWHIEWLETQKLVFRTGAGPDTVQLTLSMEGWKQVQPIPRAGGIPGRCFVAMWFDTSMTEVFELGISRAVTDCGFPPPIRIDRKEHNNQITDEIIAAIRDAEFVVADFTGNRGGVYYEAGFARGLGRPVIYCCKASDFEDRHFDTQLINHIKWSGPTDLRQNLANRIKATIIPSG